MNGTAKQIAFTLSFVCILMIATVFLFIAMAMIPYWRGFTGDEVQAWFAGPMTRFLFMVPIHLLSIVATVTAYILHRRDKLGLLWLLALVTLLICQAFNLGYYGPFLNPTLSAGTLSPSEAMATLEKWSLYHTIRTISVWISAFSMMLILIISKRSSQ